MAGPSLILRQTNANVVACMLGAAPAQVCIRCNLERENGSDIAQVLLTYKQFYAQVLLCPCDINQCPSQLNQ